MLNVRWNDNLLYTEKLYITTNLYKMYISISDKKRIHQYGCLRLEKKNNAYRKKM